MKKITLQEARRLSKAPYDTPKGKYLDNTYRQFVCPGGEVVEYRQNENAYYLLDFKMEFNSLADMIDDREPLDSFI